MSALQHAVFDVSMSGDDRFCQVPQMALAVIGSDMTVIWQYPGSVLDCHRLLEGLFGGPGVAALVAPIGALIGVRSARRPIRASIDSQRDKVSFMMSEPPDSTASPAPTAETAVM